MVVTLLVFLWQLSLPSLSQFLARHRLSIASRYLVQALTYVRWQALKQHQSLVLCPSSDGQQCDSGWQRDWIVVAKTSGAVLRYFHLPVLVQIRWRGNHASRRGIWFGPEGDTLGQQGRFSMSEHGRSQAVVLMRSGRLRLVTASVY